MENAICQYSLTETKKPKQEKNETASRSIDNLESGKRRVKISKDKSNKENVFEELQNLSDQES